MADPFAEFDEAARLDAATRRRSTSAPSTPTAPTAPTAPAPSTTRTAPVTTDLFSEFDEAARLQAERQSAASGAPTTQEIEAGARRRRVQASAAAGFASLPTGRRGLAGARHLVGSMLIIRHIPGISGFASPAEGTPERSDLDLYREGMPTSSRIGTVLGGAVPGMGIAGLAPRLMAGIPGAAAVNAGLGGADEHLGGGSPVSGAVAGLLGTVPGAAMGRALTPRNIATSTASRQAHADVIAEAQRRYAEAHRAVQAGTTGRTTSGRFARRFPPGRAREIMEEAQTRLDEARRPAPTIPRISADATGSVERAIDSATQRAMFTALGAGLGHRSGLFDPLTGGLAGMFAPTVARAGVGGANRAIDALNRGLSGPTGRTVGAGASRYFNNQILSDEMRALLNALSPSATGELGPEALSAMGLRRTGGE